MSNKLRIVFAGTPDFAARHLQALIDSEHELVAVYTRPDKPAGRGKKLTASPVKALALDHDIPVYQPKNFKQEEDQHALAELNADVMVVVAYGVILPLVVLDTPKLGCINVHGSLLPRWRGAAPIQRALWAGDQKTGVTIMQMDEGLDTGAMLLKAECEIQHTDTSASLYDKLAQSGPVALLDALSLMAKGELKAEVQNDELANYAEKLSKEEAQIDWRKSADALDREVRAFNPWPISYFSREEQNIKVLEATPDNSMSGQPGQVLKADKQGIWVATGEGAIVLKKLQLPGKKPLAAQDILNGRADWFEPGTQLELANG